MAYISFQPKDNFRTNTYTGNGTELAVTNVGFQSDSTLIKETDDGNAWNWFDSVRGATKYLKTSGNNAEATDAETLKSWQSTGYTVGNSVASNSSGGAYVGYNWVAGSSSVPSGGTITPSAVSINTTTKFGIYKYTGTGVGATIAHGLGLTPECVIIKNLSGAANWAVYSPYIVASNGGVANTTWMVLNTNVAQQSNDSGRWNNTSPTSTTFSVGVSYDQNNRSGDEYIAYCFAPKKGFSAIGKYMANSNADGSFVYTGFTPSFVMIKAADGAANWNIFDNKRAVGNPASYPLWINENAAEQTDPYPIDILSQGFKARATSSQVNSTGTDPYLYYAFAESPFVSSNSKPCVAR